MLDDCRKVNAVLALYLVPVTIGLIVILTLDWGVPAPLFIPSSAPEKEEERREEGTDAMWWMAGTGEL